jgi:hypothetical protein
MRGNWVDAEIAFGLSGLERPLLVLGPGRVYANPRQARGAYEEGRELDLPAGARASRGDEAVGRLVGRRAGLPVPRRAPAPRVP